MNEGNAFASRELLRVLRDHGPDLPAAFSRLRDALSGDLLAACARLQRELESTTKPTGDLERDSLRVAVRSVQLVHEHEGELTGELWTELDRGQLNRFEISSTVVHALLQSLLASAATAVVAVIVMTIYGIFVLPQFQSLYDSMGAVLPSLTSAVLGASRWPLFAVALGLVAITIVAFPLRLRRGTDLRHRTWRLELFAKRAWFGRSIALHYRRLLFIQYASALVDAGIHPRRSLAAASKEAEIYTDVDFESTDATTIGESLPAQLVSADRLGHLDEELAAQRALRLNALTESIEHLQLHTALVLRTILYFLVGTLIIAMYLPIFKLGSII